MASRAEELFALSSPREHEDFLEHEDDDSISEEHHDEVDLPGSIYGAGIFALTYDTAEIITQMRHDNLPVALNVFRSFFSVLMLIVNYALQVMMLIWSNSYVVHPAVHAVQRLYKDFHANVFDEFGNFDEQKWIDYPILAKRTLCQVPLSHQTFTFLIVWMWCHMMTIEFRETMRLWREIEAVPHTKRLADTIVSTSTGRHHIRHLTPLCRVLVHGFITLPKLVINFLLFVVGARWLVATPDFGGLILNFLALHFIIEIDEVLYRAFVPQTMQDDVENTKFWMHEETLNEHVRGLWKGYGRSMIWFVGGIVVCSTYIGVLQKREIPHVTVLPGYKFDLHDHCTAVIEEMALDLCQGSGVCFPFGTQTGVATATTTLKKGTR